MSIPKGEITVLIGSNGCGKSTLLKSMARLLKPVGGSVILEGKAIHQLPTKEVAKQLAILPQTPHHIVAMKDKKVFDQGKLEEIIQTVN